VKYDDKFYTLSEAWSGVNWAGVMAAQGAFGTDFYDRAILRPKHRAYYRSGRPVIKIGPKAPWAAMRSAQFTPLQASDRVYFSQRPNKLGFTNKKKRIQKDMSVKVCSYAYVYSSSP